MCFFPFVTSPDFDIMGFLFLKSEYRRLHLLPLDFRLTLLNEFGMNEKFPFKWQVLFC
jgi:hypothetical protein